MIKKNKKTSKSIKQLTTKRCYKQWRNKKYADYNFDQTISLKEIQPFPLETFFCLKAERLRNNEPLKESKLREHWYE